MKIEIYKDKKKEYRWRLKARNGRIVACSGEGYKSKASVKKGLKAMFKAESAEIVWLEKEK